ncbi:MAG: rhodanese-like domain-containing protein [Candidatus Eremiobacteraeota bacterium]|nr:rhodanese-like domain-containing protein [Candidatus Eremiobacteraeota bacterium]
MNDLSVEQLKAWRDEGRDFVLLDVRDEDEVRTVNLPGATYIRAADIPQRAAELDKTAAIAVMCHGGGRSSRVAKYLSDAGFETVYNVDGGIDAYAERIDPALARY